TKQIPEQAEVCSPEVKQVTISTVDSPEEDQTVEETKEEKAEENIADVSVSDCQPSQTVVSAMSSLASHTPGCAKKQEVKEEVPREEKPNTSETVRQMMQDEMFKLVQLQQINFMSLMQIVQSSFTNVPTMQQMLQQHQLVNLAGNQPAHTTESSASPKTQVPT
ncbi:CPLN1 protein, partial [Pardalotus punctatus]|nr:CPLN1 protein [Pardalotus punctatus]